MTIPRNPFLHPIQPKPAGAQPPRQAPVAPAVYRPQPVPKVLQTKMSEAQRPANQTRAVAAPPVYRPQPVPRVLQTKARPIAGQQSPAGPPNRGPVAPPVYRPNRNLNMPTRIVAGAPSRTAPAPGPPASRPAVNSVQPKLHVQGSKGGLAIPRVAKGTAKRIKQMGAALLPGGANHIANVQGRGLMGYTAARGKEFVGGNPYNNNPMPDGSKLPLATYTEWDVNPCTAGVGRDQERIVKSAGDDMYYTADHYANFTEFTV